MTYLKLFPSGQHRHHKWVMVLVWEMRV